MDYFVCVLAYLNASTNHCIGIDCAARLVYNAVGLQAKRLTIENIGYCAGLVYNNTVGGGFVGFSAVAQITNKIGK